MSIHLQYRNCIHCLVEFDHLLQNINIKYNEEEIKGKLKKLKNQQLITQ